jgi:integrase
MATGAEVTNPSAATGMRRLESGDHTLKRPVRALTADERTDLLAKIDAEDRAVPRDLPDLFRFLIGTGCRIGEALAVRWRDVDLDRATLVINGNIVPIRGRGLVRHSGKTAAAVRTVPLAEFLVTMLRMRLSPETTPTEPVFATPS